MEPTSCFVRVRVRHSYAWDVHGNIFLCRENVRHLDHGAVVDGLNQDADGERLRPLRTSSSRFAEIIQRNGQAGQIIGIENVRIGIWQEHGIFNGRSEHLRSLVSRERSCEPRDPRRGRLGCSVHALSSNEQTTRSLLCLFHAPNVCTQHVNEAITPDTRTVTKLIISINRVDGFLSCFSQELSN